MRKTLRILDGGGGHSTLKVDATGTPLPCTPRTGLVFELHYRDSSRARTFRIRTVNSRSFYIASWGAPPTRVPLDQWDAWLDALMREGELRLVDYSMPHLKLVEGAGR